MELPQHEDLVRAEWIDANGHMNLAYYVVVFDRAADVVFEVLDIGAAYRVRSGNSSFVAETHTVYEREVTEGERLLVTTRLLGTDAKRLHVFHEMFRAAGGERVATQEQMCLHVDMAARRVVPFPPATQLALAAAVQAQAGLPVPDNVGRRIVLTREAERSAAG